MAVHVLVIESPEEKLVAYTWLSAALAAVSAICRFMPPAPGPAMIVGLRVRLSGM
jgi:hypothetical protein